MRGNPRNVRLLSDKELSDIKDKYHVFVTGNNVVVKMRHRSQTTMHDISASFALRVNNRKFTISETTTEMWYVNFYETHTVFDIQHAINCLAVDRQKITIEAVKDKLEGGQ